MRLQLAVVAVALAGVFAACAGMDDAGAYRLLALGDPAPAYGARSLAGDSVDFAELEGTPLLVNLWATWCTPCRSEMPELQELHERYEGRLRVIGVSIDQGASEELIRGFLDDVGVEFDILLDPAARVSRRFTTVGVPETFLIDGRGIVRHRWIGRFMPLAAENVEIIEGVVAASPEARTDGG